MRFLIGLLLFSITAPGQDIFSKDSSFVKIIEGLPGTEPFDTAHSYHRVTNAFVYIISDKDLYDIFGYETAAGFYEFNFAEYHILGQQVCKHEEGNDNCHRNLCDKEWIWLMRENKKAFTEILSKKKLGHIDAGYPSEAKYFFHDTIQDSKAGDSLVNWYTSGHGDCFARFEYKIFKDNYHPVLILKEWNYWGGCRAGGSWDFTVSFVKPDGIRQYSKNTILAGKYGDPQ